MQAEALCASYLELASQKGITLKQSIHLWITSTLYQNYAQGYALTMHRYVSVEFHP
jgi:hypothetical protein